MPESQGNSTVLHAASARLPGGWAENVRLEIGADGRFTAVDPNTAARGTPLPGPVIPGMPNLHSHAFQRAMAGLAETHSANGDDFWSWREAMYRFLARLTPEDVEIVATQLYIEMLKAGFTRVCEFHYLHNDIDGRPYADRAIMAQAHLRAAQRAGIAITLAPTLYAHGGCGGMPLKPEQARFATTPDKIVGIIEDMDRDCADIADATVAVGLHSLRAVTPDEARAVIEALPDRAVHIHVSEQIKEVEECVAWCGRTPVAELTHSIGLNKNWCLVHGTHITTGEITAITQAGATVALCPATEGNLGDGFFPAKDYFAAKGSFGIGTDSQISVDPREDLRWFEYGRRLKAQRRGVSADARQPHVGAWLWLNAAEGGRQPCAAPVGRMEVGARADFLVLDAALPSLYDRSGDTLLDAFVFAAIGPAPIAEVWSGGKCVVANGRHDLEEESARAWRKTLDRMKQA